MFKEPAAINEIHIAVPGPEFNPLMHKGALLRVSPEEITSAFALAIARDIANNECESVLRTWRKFALSATGEFVVSWTATERYWYAFQQREWFSTVNAAVHRTTFQRIHEISRLMKKLRETHPASETTSAAIAEQYAKNLQMAAGRLLRGMGAIPLMGVIDMCPGDGSLALAAFKRGICYTGLCMSDMHNNQLNAYLEQRIFHTMSDPNSLIYEPRLVASLQTTPTPKAAATPAAKKKATPKPKEEGDPQNKQTRIETADEQDECGDEDDDQLSGDEE